MLAPTAGGLRELWRDSWRSLRSVLSRPTRRMYAERLVGSRAISRRSGWIAWRSGPWEVRQL
jgi:hypothetical protein